MVEVRKLQDGPDGPPPRMKVRDYGKGGNRGSRGGGDGAKRSGVGTRGGFQKRLTPVDTDENGDPLYD
jgi:hypothetical protein|tara:strand:+ start:1353 stop:1556 length:204 start_codon:yes stop_codon:yes gene_type:complete